MIQDVVLLMSKILRFYHVELHQAAVDKLSSVLPNMYAEKFLPPI